MDLSCKFRETVSLPRNYTSTFDQFSEFGNFKIEKNCYRRFKMFLGGHFIQILHFLPRLNMQDKEQLSNQKKIFAII